MLNLFKKNNYLFLFLTLMLLNGCEVNKLNNNLPDKRIYGFNSVELKRVDENLSISMVSFFTYSLEMFIKIKTNPEFIPNVRYIDFNVYRSNGEKIEMNTDFTNIIFESTRHNEYTNYYLVNFRKSPVKNYKKGCFKDDIFKIEYFINYEIETKNYYYRDIFYLDMREKND